MLKQSLGRWYLATRHDRIQSPKNRSSASYEANQSDTLFPSLPLKLADDRGAIHDLVKTTLHRKIISKIER